MPYYSVFTVMPDGNLKVRIGTQSNCAGFGIVIASIQRTENNAIDYTYKQCDSWDECFYVKDIMVSGDKLTPMFLKALYDGARKAFSENCLSANLIFTLVAALDHPVDGTSKVFYQAGYDLVNNWIRLEKELKK